MKKLCVFCGSSHGVNSNYTKEAIKLGQLLANNGIELVYGGGSIGIMGELADAVLAEGGRVTGVIPRFLYEKEVGHDGISELHIVETMHERKMKMAQLSEGFLALPGGIGTMEEIFEIFTWSQLGLIKFPVAILNIDGYYDQLFGFIDKMKKEEFVKENTLKKLIRLTNVDEVISIMKQWKVGADGSGLSKT